MDSLLRHVIFEFEAPTRDVVITAKGVEDNKIFCKEVSNTRIDEIVKPTGRHGCK